MISLTNPSTSEQQLRKLSCMWRIATFDGLKWLVDYCYFRDNAESIGESHLKQLGLWHKLYIDENPYHEPPSRID